MTKNEPVTLLGSLRAILLLGGLTLLACCVVYVSLLLVVGRVLAPDQAAGSLVYDEAGQAIGSSRVAQGFEHPAHVWPRPSAAGYAANAAAGSNLAPSNPALRERVEADLLRYGASEDRPIPADLVTASGSGLDPHISLDGAIYQAPRIAAARGVDLGVVEERLRSLADQPSPFSPPLINVLEANLELDRTFGPPEPMP